LSRHHAKAIPFIVIAIAVGFMAIDMFTDYSITQNHVDLITYVLAPLGLGGLVNKGWNTWQKIKEVQAKNGS